MVLAFDLDGTLIGGELAEKIYEEAYKRTVEIMREMGIEIHDKFESYSFENSCELARRFRLFGEIYKDVYPQVLKKYIDDIRKERRRAKAIYKYFTERYRPKYVFILTANPMGDVIIKEILPEIPTERILIVNGLTYVEDKKRALERLKILGEVKYIADKDEIDRVAAMKAGVDYINVSFVIEELKRVERDLYDLGIFSA